MVGSAEEVDAEGFQTVTNLRLHELMVLLDLVLWEGVGNHYLLDPFEFLVKRIYGDGLNNRKDLPRMFRLYILPIQVLSTVACELVPKFH